MPGVWGMGKRNTDRARFDAISADDARELPAREKLPSALLAIEKGFDLRRGDRYAPNRKLMWYVVERAIIDAILYRGSKVGNNACEYLMYDLRHASLCGVGPEWIRRKLDEMGLPFTPKYG